MDYGSVSSFDEVKKLLPTTTYGVLNNGKVTKLDIDSDSWEATYTTLQNLGSYIPSQFDSPEFNPNQEGIYVYKAKIKSSHNYVVSSDIFIECRINYFSYKNNFNGHERSIEYLDRGLYAIKNTVFDTQSKTYIDSAEGGIFLSWRILVDEYEKVSNGNPITFEIYRNNEKIAYLDNTTNYLDKDGNVGDIYLIKATQNQVTSFSKEVEALNDNYISIPLQRPLPSYSQTGNFAMYRLNDTEVADVDGDGEYEIIVKWYPGNGFDPGTSAANKMSSPHIIDVYKLDGTALWRLFMGYSSPSGQHFDNFMVYDLDQDGKAELSILTQDGTRSYRPDENGKFRYLTTDTGGYVFRADDPNNSESTGTYVLSEDGAGYILNNGPEYDFAYVGDYGSPILDDTYLIDVVGDISLEGVNMRNDGFKEIGVNEYFTVFNGETGQIIDTVDYYFTTEKFLYNGSVNYNTSNRYNIAIAYIPSNVEDPHCTEAIPAVLANRAYYSRATVIAYTLVNGRIHEAWRTDTVDEIKGGGNHNMVTGNIDNDGFDELYLGGTAIDHDGSILWAKDGEYNKDFMKHGDAIHMSPVFPDSNQLYVFTPVEDKSVSAMLNYALTNGATGARIVGHTFTPQGADTGRGMLANVTPNAGYEIWASTPSGIVNGRIGNALFNAYGDMVTYEGTALKRPAVQTWSGYWDGDLLSELPDSNPAGGGDKSGLPQGVHKYNWQTGETEVIASFAGTLTNNSSKNNPNLMADILGDWREEILARSSNNEELRIYMTNIPTDYTIYTLMHDPVYRNSVANQNTTYNQPTHTSFYLGEDEESRNKVLNFGLPTYNYRYTSNGADSSIGAIINPLLEEFHKNAPNDITTNITWVNGSYITDIKNDTISIGTDAYAVSGSSLVIKKEYLSLQPKGILTLEIEFDKGINETFIIGIKDSSQTGIIDAAISPDTAVFDKNTQNQIDVETVITWNDATSVTDIKQKGKSIGVDAYAVSKSAITGIFIAEGNDIPPANDDVAVVSGSALSIKKEYLALQEVGQLLLTVEFDKGDSAPFIITITDTTPPQEKEPKSAVLTPVEIQADKNPVRLQDIRTSITWNDAKAVMDVKKNGVSIGAHMFTVTGNTLTIRKEFIAMEQTGTLILTVEFDKGEEAYLIITITDSTPVTVPESTTPPQTIYQPQIFVEQAAVDGIERAARIIVTKADKDGVMKAVIELSAENILAAAEGEEQPLTINLSLSTDNLLEEVKANDTKTVAITVKVPDSLSNSKKMNLNMELDLDLLKAIKESGKTLTVSVTNQGNQELYSWTFSGKNLAESKKDLEKVSLSLKVAALSKELRTKLQEKQKDATGFILDFSHTGSLPAQAAVKIYVGNEKSIKTGDKIYLYHYNETTRKLETLPYSSNYQVDEDGYITIHILHCSDYVVLPKEADKSVMSTLRNQVLVTVDNTVLYIGDKEKSVARTKVELPNTLEIVKNIKDKTSNSNIGGVTISYSSTNKKAAMVDSTGKITAVGEGSAVIIAKITLYSGKVKVVNMQVTVKEPSITMTTKTTAMKTGETFTFKAKASDDLNMKDAIWKTTEKSIVVIDKKTGVATAKSKGVDYVVVSIGNVSEKIKVVVK